VIIDLDADDPFEAVREAAKKPKKRPYLKSNTQTLICGLQPLGNNA
jgi:hypothetical protein